MEVLVQILVLAVPGADTIQDPHGLKILPTTKRRVCATFTKFKNGIVSSSQGETMPFNIQRVYLKGNSLMHPLFFKY